MNSKRETTEVLPDEKEMLVAIELLHEPGARFEVRAILSGKGALCGLFDWNQRREAIRIAISKNREGCQCYVTMNPIRHDGAQRVAKNELGVKGVEDVDIERRRWLLVDLDPERVGKVSSSQTELDAALSVGQAIKDHFDSIGWPAPLIGQSGNGMHLLYPIDLPNDVESGRLIARVLKKLAREFGTKLVKIDTSVSNAARITKFYGTVSKKGEHTSERPWRPSTLSGQRSDRVVAKEQLEQFAPASERNAYRSAAEHFDVEKFLTESGLAFVHDQEKGYDRFRFERCPCNSEHGFGEAAILRFEDGKVKFKCFHDSCSDKRLRHVFELVLGANGLKLEHRRAIEDDEVKWLASLTPMDRDREIKPLAELLGVNVSTLRESVKGLSGGLSDLLQGSSVVLMDHEPWDEPVDGVELVSDLVAGLERFLYLPAHASLTIALWILHTFIFDRFDWTPKLAILSPLPGCGKSCLLSCLSYVVPRSVESKSATSAALMRLIGDQHPVLLIDEADAISPENEEMRALLNGSSQSGSKCIRCDGPQNIPRQFPIFTPIAFAMIGFPWPTVADRSLPIRLERKPRSVKLEKATRRRVESTFAELGRKCARWANDNVAKLVEEPDMPSELGDRASDNWTPLVAIADTIGGLLPGIARKAAIALSSSHDSDEQQLPLRLLEDIRGILLTTSGDGYVGSRELCQSLSLLPDSPWAEFGRKKEPITPPQLAKILRPFELRSQDRRRTIGVIKVYPVERFEAVFDRYLPPLAETPQL